MASVSEDVVFFMGSSGNYPIFKETQFVWFLGSS
jgi:hypothetical protein